MNHRRVLASLLLVTACGPKTPSADEGGSTSEPGTTTMVEASTGSVATSTTAEPETTSDDTGISTATEGATDETGVTCMDPELYFVPGCGEAGPLTATIEAGCYQPCDQRTPCNEGFCMQAWIDPCYGSKCDACGGEQGLCLTELPTGSPCGIDENCASGVCWNFNAYDPCCFGTVCSGPCMTDDECIELAAAAEAPNPRGATCGRDGRCVLMGAGLGSYACAGPMCG